MDGTDQLSNGIPQFREISKDDCGQMRIKSHLEIVQIAAAPDIVKCFVVPEDIRGGSQVSVEVLQRTLKAEERRRGGKLPRVLYIQLDNCRGSNKNTYLFSYLAWLVERGVFDVIYVSFLPVGHTHNGPDRIASRISNAVRRVDIPSEKVLLELIHGSHNPRPEVELIEKVAGFKKLVNPNESQAFTGALVHQLEGLCKPRAASIVANQKYMEKTSYLHFRIAKTSSNDVCVQNRQTIDVPDWSAVEYIWKKSSTRSATGLLDDLRAAPSAPIPDLRAEELLKNLKGCSWRVSPIEYQTLVNKVRQMNLQRPEKPLHWTDGGLFQCEWDESEDEDEYDAEEDRSADTLQLPCDQNTIIYNRNDRKELHEKTLAIEIAVNDFIAYKPFYLPDVPATDRKPIHVGQVTILNVAQRKLQIRCYITPAKDPLAVGRGKGRGPYKPWRSKNANDAHTDVILADIYSKFTMPKDKWQSGFQLSVPTKEAILKDIEAHRLNNQYS
jgi:hypothetical protein